MDGAAGLGVGAAVGTGVAVGAGVAVGIGVAVGANVAVGTGVAVGAGVAVGTTVAVGAGVAVGTGAAVGARVAVGTGVAVGAGVAVRTGAAVGTGADARTVVTVVACVVAACVDAADSSGLSLEEDEYEDMRVVAESAIPSVISVACDDVSESVVPDELLTASDLPRMRGFVVDPVMAVSAEEELSSVSAAVPDRFSETLVIEDCEP